MPFPLVENPMGGNLGATTCSVFVLDPTGTTALEPLIDLVPGLTPLRTTFDMVDGETAVFDYDVTEHAIQDFLDIASHVHKKLETITINGTLGATPPLSPIPPPPVPGSLARLDLLRVKNLKNMADARTPVMVVTPRMSLAKALFTNIQQIWSPSDGESTQVSCVFREVRIVSPVTGDIVAPDYASQTPGNNAASGGGQSSTSNADAAGGSNSSSSQYNSARSPGSGHQIGPAQ